MLEWMVGLAVAAIAMGVMYLVSVCLDKVK